MKQDLCRVRDGDYIYSEHATERNRGVAEDGAMSIDEVEVEEGESARITFMFNRQQKTDTCRRYRRSRRYPIPCFWFYRHRSLEHHR